MTTFPGSPRVMKGAIVGLDPINPYASIVIFQYNPDTLRRTLQAQATGASQNNGSIDRTEALRLRGAPIETITPRRRDRRDRSTGQRRSAGQQHRRVPAAVGARNAALSEEQPGHRQHHPAR